MTRIDKKFQELKTQGRKGLVTFVMAGDPNFSECQNILSALPAAGADLIEIGMPFSDPMADGPSVQAAGLRALKSGASMERTLDLARSFREKDKDTPLVLMGYFNPIYIYGTTRFVQDAASAGVDGLIVVDLPPEEDAELREPAARAGLSLIRLVTPTTDAARLPRLLEGASGFLYYVSITGITGAATAQTHAVATHLEQVRAHTDLPLAIGFGIRTPADAARLAPFGDAVVVGSALVEECASSEQDAAQRIAKRVQALRTAL